METANLDALREVLADLECEEPSDARERAIAKVKAQIEALKGRGES